MSDDQIDEGTELVNEQEWQVEVEDKESMNKNEEDEVEEKDSNEDDTVDVFVDEEEDEIHDRPQKEHIMNNVEEGLQLDRNNEDTDISTNNTEDAVERNHACKERMNSDKLQRHVCQFCKRTFRKNNVTAYYHHQQQHMIKNSK